jgi:hypothetical protein
MLEIPHAARFALELGLKMPVLAFRFGHLRCLRLMSLLEIPTAGRFAFEPGLKVFVSALGHVV